MDAVEHPEKGTPQPDPRSICGAGGSGPDKRIDEMLDNLKAIHKALSAAPGEMPVSVIKELADTVKDILSVVRGRAGGEVIEEVQLINYPISGKKDLPVGTITIDIKSRQVILPDGSSEEIYSPFKIDMARSLVLYTDGTISVILLKDGTPVYTSSVYPLWSRFKDFEFDQMVITTTKKTLFYMGVSNTPDSVPDMIEAPYIEGNPFVYRGSVPTAGTPVEIDVRAAAGYNVQTGFIANMGTTAGKLYIYEDAGEGYTSDYYTIVKDGVENLMKCNISKIKIDSNVDNTTFELNFR